MDNKEIKKINLIIKSLKNVQLSLKKTDIEYEMLEKVIFSLNRKIDMGDNPYKMKSFGNLDDPDILSDFLLDF